MVRARARKSSLAGGIGGVVVMVESCSWMVTR
jgi:hypothetical protein